jgi:hypothetical protein
MIIRFSSNSKLKIRLPFEFLPNQDYELTFHLPKGTSELAVSMLDGYRLREFTEPDKAELISLHERCGFDFSLNSLERALDLCLPGGVFLVEHCESSALVSTMMARHLASPEFPFGGRIDWLASDLAHRGKGLGRLAAKLATNHLIRIGYQNIWVTTQPHRLDAIKIFTSLGFVPTEQTLREYSWGEIQKNVLTHVAK